MGIVKVFWQTAYTYGVAVMPWLILGIGLAYVIERKVSKKTISHHFHKISLKGLFLTQILGMVSPLSIMSFLPIANELEEKGFNAGLLLSFLIAERSYDLQSFFIISGLFGLRYALLNSLAILVSLIFTSLFLHRAFVHFSLKKSRKEVSFGWRHTRLLLMVLVGIVVAALIRSLVPVELVEQYAGGKYQGFMAAMGLGFLLYFGPVVGNYPVAKAFADLGMSPLGTLTFLTVSPIFNLVIMMMFGATVGSKSTMKAFMIYTISAMIMSLIFSFWL